MTSTLPETALREVLKKADVRVNGGRPWDIRVHNPLFFRRVMAGGSLALGDSYVDGWWDCDALDRLFDRIMGARLDQTAKRCRPALHARLLSVLTCSPSRFRSGIVGRRHYDIGNDLFGVMLDKWMNYSCAYWPSADSLEAAQVDKMELVCRKLQLKSGMRVVDIGCGWGGLAAYAARHYGVAVVGITVSRRQVQKAREMGRGLPVAIRLQDYRHLEGRFDRAVSIGMLEHVGWRRYRTFFRRVRSCLAPDGLLLLQTIAGNRSVRSIDPWVGTHIFPNSMLPSARQITAAAEGIMVLEDWHSFGPDYDPTLMAWHRNVTANRDRLADRYDPRFFRMWTYYLLCCAGTFRARRNQLYQIVFSRDGLRGGYRCRRTGSEPNRRPPVA
jgi:cyclopropane-fatty-acyl-phospholipid synthase